MVISTQNSASVHSYSNSPLKTTSNVANQSSTTDKSDASKGTQKVQTSSSTSSKRVQSLSEDEGLVLTSQDGDVATFSTVGLQKSQNLTQETVANSLSSASMTNENKVVSQLSASSAQGTETTGASSNSPKVAEGTGASSTSTQAAGSTGASSTSSSEETTSSDLSQYTISELKEMLSDGSITRSEYNSEIESRTSSDDNDEEKANQLSSQKQTQNQIQQTASQSSSGFLTSIDVNV